ncbi:CBS domain-containing protein [Pseudoduganella ginsengisoli]|uniref:CBS domain-containing protein n=1 Tax=Pseudoduganella ginsengisoli TaxID=1462440 RepID=A0A6L6Q826_9BURK|nr:CBS domain-containing protein [Pseudoduganella ginsengisoli]
MLDRAALGTMTVITQEAPVSVLYGLNPPPVALPGETCRIVATRMAVHGVEHLPVVADTESLRLIGVVSRSDLVKPALSLHKVEYEWRAFRRMGQLRT